MKRIATICLLSLFCLAAAPAKAQFLKRLFGKEDPPKRKPAPRPTQTAKPAATAKKPVVKARKTEPDEIHYPQAYKKDRYRVDVLIPLYLNELVKNGKAVYRDKMPDKVLPGINFYEGVKMAIDSIDRFGYEMDVYVHDITEAGKTPEALIASKALDSSDLIIGAVGSGQIAPLAAFAKKQEINFISAMSPSDGNVKNNPYFTLLQPTLQTNCEWLQRIIVKKYGNTRILVYRRSSVPVDELAYKNLVKDSVLKTTQVNADVLPKPELLGTFFDSTEINVIAMPILDVAYAGQLLAQLGKAYPNYKLEVYGMPSWKGLSVLKKGKDVENVAINFTTPFFFDASTASGQNLAGGYSRTYGRRPGEMVYRGFETLYWYCYLLNKYGPVFNREIGDNASAMYTRFEVKPRFTKDFDLLYNENTHLYLYRYQNGSFMVEQ
jgi:hypothetical protein